MMKFNLLIFMLLVIWVSYILMMLPSNLYKFHPMFLGSLLIMYVIVVSFMMNFVLSSYWYSYILFLLVVGGLMILFMYFTSLANNQLFTLSSSYYFSFIKKFTFLWIVLFVGGINNDFSFFLTLFNEIVEVSNVAYSSDMYIVKILMMDYLVDVNIFMLMYLFYTMICSILLCQKMMMPLRQLVKI